MPKRLSWEQRHSLGQETLDHQHREIVARCNDLADCVADSSPLGQTRFREAFEQLMSYAREHFVAEEALLVRGGYPDLEEHRHEREEYEYLAAEIITTENFDPEELQTFLALWWAGHILGAARQQKRYLEGLSEA